MISVYVKDGVAKTKLDLLWDGLSASAGLGAAADTTDVCGTACTI